MKIYLIRHPAPQRDPTKPAALWRLSARGEQEAAALALLPWWPQVSYLYSSIERKSVAAALIIGQTHKHLVLEKLARLNEAQRPLGYVSDEEYRQRVQNFFDYPDRVPVEGWESADQVQARVVQAMNELASLPHNGPLAIISHGLALTIYRAYLLNRPATFEDWQLLSSGCWAVADPAKQTLIQDWTALYMY